MAKFLTIPDAHLRRLAVTTFDRNVVVVAGAGTGKTTLLVNRFIHTLMQNPFPATITQMVALTFTNKAAAEMKTRLREQLLVLAKSDHSQHAVENSGVVTVDELRQDYQLSSNQISERATAALHDLEKAQIGTVHSFAAHLLRLNPVESRVDPLFQEDDGPQFENYFNREWEFWLDRELGPQGENHRSWRGILKDLSLKEIRGMARLLCDEIVALDELEAQLKMVRVPEGIREWLATQHARIGQLLAQHENGRTRKIEIALTRGQEVIQAILDGGVEHLADWKGRVDHDLNFQFGQLPSGWDDNDFREARRLISLAKALVSVDHGLIDHLLCRLLPFVHQVRERFIDEGWVTFNGLLARTSALLRQNQIVRERLKKEYQAILVDEFQDTDPLQYEIILYLAERVGTWSCEWKQVELAPGKLFIVGDPKQSIYAFRRADLEAYDQVVKKVEDAGGVVLKLSTNFRSHEKVLEIVNAVFARVLKPVANVQPENVHLMTQPDRKGEVTQPGVELHVVKLRSQSGKKVDSSAATRVEAEHLARWIKEELLGKARLIDPSGRSTPLQPGHIGFLLRKLTEAQDYLDALRGYAIPYVTDGEKHFYLRQEVVDLINVLRVIENPSDTIALIGVLRSPLGALTDQEIHELRVREALDYRRGESLGNWASPRLEGIKRLFAVLKDLGRQAMMQSIPAIIDDIFSRLPVMELAMASLHGEQAVANLLKFRELAERETGHSGLSLNEFIDLLIKRVRERQEESEGGVAEESLDAVRVLSVHKAKGLEFPVVILPGLHHGTNLSSERSLVSDDWATGTIGMSVGERGSVGSVLVREKLRRKEEAEQRRVLYVAMTRAKERLILSCGVPDRRPAGSFLEILDEATDTPIGSEENSGLQIGKSVLPQTVVSQPDSIAGRRPRRLSGQLKAPPHMNERWKLWDIRERRWREAFTKHQFLSPTSLLDTDERQGRWGRDMSPGTSKGLMIGTLAHRILEAWDYGNDFAQFNQIIERISQSDLFRDSGENGGNLQGELREIFRVFSFSELYRRLQRATIVGREVPFVIPWDCSEQPNQDIKNGCSIMEGRIDLVYKLDGYLWVADYKTDHLECGDPGQHCPTYEAQARIYREAAARCLGLTHAGCQLIFIRHGISVEI